MRTVGPFRHENQRGKVRSEKKIGASVRKQTNTLERRGGGREPSESSEDDDDERRCTHGCMKTRYENMVVGMGETGRRKVYL